MQLIVKAKLVLMHAVVTRTIVGKDAVKHHTGVILISGVIARNLAHGMEPGLNVTIGVIVALTAFKWSVAKSVTLERDICRKLTRI